MQRLKTVCASVGLLIIPSLLYAQASITGVARDTSGAVLPGVNGESPVVDVQSSNRERVLTAEVINNAPVNRYPSFIASMIPGVNNSTVDVGGNSGSPTTGGGALTVHGSRATDLEMLRNGVSIST